MTQKIFAIDTLVRSPWASKYFLLFGTRFQESNREKPITDVFLLVHNPSRKCRKSLTEVKVDKIG